MVLRAGVAGAGVFGGYHANKYVEAEAAELTAIYDAIEHPAAALASKHGCDGTTDYDAFLNKIDVLTITAPATYHFELAEKALLAGKHVLVEKPIALHLSDADKLLSIASEKDLILQVGHQERYVFEAFGLLDRPAPKEVHSRRLNKFSGRAMDVSVVFDLMIHDLDLLNQVAHGDVTALTATATCRHGEKSDHTETHITFSSGTKATLAASRLEEEPVRDMRLVYDDGEIHINFLKREVSNTTGTALTTDFEADNPPLAFRDPLAFGTQSFLKAVEENARPTVDGVAGRAALDLALRVEAASANA
ncbi:Gfo/Idh/MocA family protein [Parvularcula sp. IMCC14364]|uniref:Gfo/Idh/MocA family protein n=1 Tax=Parvularcula sp. IMCC14364 TaxID=3067902 RepID=UPI002740D800|nr:Gfo/Idh/MocA family oxidoreductase [Parvularcula sp. IMCC14364]